MSQIPEYQTPPTGDPKSLVAPPAIALMVVGGIGIALQAVGLLFHILGVGMGAASARGGNEALASVAILNSVLQSYGFAMTASIIAMIPCISPCCLLGLPFGIWALVVLSKPEVKSAFTA